MNSLWIADFPLMTLLAVTRILIFSNVIGSKRFPILIKLILCSIITWALFLIIVGSFTQNFLLVTPGWDYDFTVSNAEIFATLEVIISFACLALSYVSYILMVYLIYAVSWTNTFCWKLANQNVLEKEYGRVRSLEKEWNFDSAPVNICNYLHNYNDICLAPIIVLNGFIHRYGQSKESSYSKLLSHSSLLCQPDTDIGLQQVWFKKRNFKKHSLVYFRSIRNEFLKLLGFRKGNPYNNGVVSKLSSIHPTETSPN